MSCFSPPLAPMPKLMDPATPQTFLTDSRMNLCKRIRIPTFLNKTLTPLKLCLIIPEEDGKGKSISNSFPKYQSLGIYRYRTSTLFSMVIQIPLLIKIASYLQLKETQPQILLMILRLQLALATPLLATKY